MAFESEVDTEIRERSRAEIRSLECPRCYSHARLDEYRDHIAKCGGQEPSRDRREDHLLRNNCPGDVDLYSLSTGYGQIWLINGCRDIGASDRGIAVSFIGDLLGRPTRI